jgi:ABC-2 type transport system permease protein
MTTPAYALTDSATMVRRNVKRMRRDFTILYVAGIPIFFLLLFVYVLGGTLGAGLGGGLEASASRADYVAYLTPGILLMTVAGAATGTAIAVAIDMTEGIIARFRTMAIARSSVLAGHVIANVVQTMLAVAIVTAVAVLIGFRPATGPAEWLAAAGLLALMSFGMTWIGVALGMVSKSVGIASNIALPFLLLPFFGSGFVPTESMPEPLHTFAENQPFTPMIEALRGLLFGTPSGNSALLAVAWSIAFSIVGYLWAMRRYNRGSLRS